jgi:hypothetical protein
MVLRIRALYRNKKSSALSSSTLPLALDNKSTSNSHLHRAVLVVRPCQCTSFLIAVHWFSLWISDLLLLPQCRSRFQSLSTVSASLDLFLLHRRLTLSPAAWCSQSTGAKWRTPKPQCMCIYFSH